MKTDFCAAGLTAAVLVACVVSAAAQISFTGSHEEGFDTLPAVGSQSLAGTATLGLQVAVPGLPGWQAARLTGTGTSNVTIQTAQLTGGRLYSYGSSGVAERALGALGSGTAAMGFGTALVNDTGKVVTALHIEFWRETWMLQSTTTANQYTNRLAFSWGVAGPELTETTFLSSPLMMAAPDLDAVAPGELTLTLVVDGDNPARQRDGNAAEFRSKVSGDLTGLDWQPGAVLFLRWNDRDDGGFDAGVGIDDLKITIPGPPAPPSLAIAPVPSDRVRLSWDTVPGRFYELQRSRDLAVWPAEGGVPFEAAGRALGFVDDVGERGFFRVVQREAAPVAAPLLDGQVEALFSAIGPDGTTEDTVLEGRLLELLAKAKPGSSVRAAVYTWDRMSMADAFVAAQERGVDVRVISGGDFPAVQSLVERLPAGHVISCRNALGEVMGAMGGRINHNKFFLFSDVTGDGPKVAVQSSANLTEFQLTRNNNMVILRGRPEVYDAYLRYWNDMSLCVAEPDYYRVSGQTAPVGLHCFPRATADAGTGSGDPVVEALDGLDANAGGSIRVAMATWSNPRSAIARKLVALHGAGMDVAVLVNPTEAGSEILALLEGAGIPVRRYAPLHSKYLLMDGVWRSAQRKVVLTGSQNFTDPALTGNDETMLRIESEAIHGRFMADWNAMATHPLAQ